MRYIYYKIEDNDHDPHETYYYKVERKSGMIKEELYIRDGVPDSLFIFIEGQSMWQNEHTKISKGEYFYWRRQFKLR